MFIVIINYLRFILLKVCFLMKLKQDLRQVMKLKQDLRQVMKLKYDLGHMMRAWSVQLLLNL